jgi:tRNA nucleotidyltransferase/poly(A) polymerase
MKGASLALKLGLTIEENTLSAMQSMALGLNLLKGELVKRELIKMLSSTDEQKVSQMLINTKIAEALFPFAEINKNGNDFNPDEFKSWDNPKRQR